VIVAGEVGLGENSIFERQIAGLKWGATWKKTNVSQW